MINVDDQLRDPTVEAAHCDGIGLTRSEFLFYGHGDLPDEETQYACYRRLVALGGGAACDGPDAGCRRRQADQGPGRPRANPTLPWACAACASSLHRPEIFEVQPAPARAADSGPAEVMVPMVTAPWELERRSMR